MVLGKLDRYIQKNEARLPSYTIHKNKFKMDQRLKCKPQTITILEENIGSKISGIVDVDPAPQDPCVVAAMDKFTRSTEILWRKRDGMATL